MWEKQVFKKSLKPALFGEKPGYMVYKVIRLWALPFTIYY